MREFLKKISSFLVGIIVFLFLTSPSFAASQGHYYPGVIALRDSVMPPPGNYTGLYDIYYHAGRYKDPNGNDFKNVTANGAAEKDFHVLNHPVKVTLDAAANVDLKFKVDNIGHQLMQIWAPEKKILGANYAAVIAPYFGYQRIRIDALADVAGVLHVGNHLSTPIEATRGKKIIDDKYGFGDLYVRPLWLDWRGKHYDMGINYGFYAPVGNYSKKDIANIGMGFFTSQIQQTIAYYPWVNKATAIILNSTHELHSKKYDTALTPGQDLTFEYGVSQYLSERFEVAASGYSQMQISDDSGGAATNKSKHRQIHGVGGDVNYWLVKGKLLAELRYTYEYGGEATFQGHNGALSFVYKWGKPIEG